MESTLLTGFTSPCMHVPMCGPHKHRPMYSTVPLKTGRLLTEPQHQPVKNIAISKKTVRPHPEDFTKGGKRHLY